MKNRNRRTVLAAIPVVLVNLVAFAGQLAFLHDHLPWPLPGQVLVAVALESIAIYLAWHAHVAQVANDSALRLRLAAYASGLLIGAMNYSHYAVDGWRPTFAAITVGLMSASSPWLWSVHSRRASRDVLLAAGLIEPHALRLGSTRWMWHPVLSFRVMRRATWEGETDPQAAIAAIEPEPGVLAVSPAPFTDAQSAAAEALARSVGGGNPLSQRQLMTRYRLTRGEETKVREQVFSLNGHGPSD